MERESDNNLTYNTSMVLESILQHVFLCLQLQQQHLEPVLTVGLQHNQDYWPKREYHNEIHLYDYISSATPSIGSLNSTNTTLPD